MRKRTRNTDEPHHERWLVSYADFMTLLFALFVVLFASSHHDKRMLPRLSSAIKGGFQQMGSFSGTAIANDSSFEDTTIDLTDGSTATGKSKPNIVTGTTGIDVVELQEKLQRAVGKEIQRHEVVMRMTPEGFVISLRELGFFDSGEARLLPGAADKIKRIAAVLMQYGLDMRVEGHSDDIPIHNAVFASNWELSTARAMAVAMMLLDDSGFDPKKISIAGYGQYHPAASNHTLDGRKMNRRVDLVVVSTTRPALGNIQ